MNERTERNPLDFIIDQELEFERRVRRVAVLSWSVTFATLPIMGIAMFVIDQGGGTSVDAARWFLGVVGAAGALCLIAALLTTISWLFRSRAASLAAIDRRLATLEQILLSR